MKKINIFKINCQKIKILKIKHGATQNSISTENSSNFWVDQPQKLSIKTKEMSSSGPIGKSENNPEQDCRNYYTSSHCC